MVVISGFHTVLFSEHTIQRLDNKLNARK